MKQQTVGTTFLPTQTDALQFIQLERFRRDRHRFKSSDQDTESESEDEAPRERGARIGFTNFFCFLGPLGEWMRVVFLRGRFTQSVELHYEAK